MSFSFTSPELRLTLARRNQIKSHESMTLLFWCVFRPLRSGEFEISGSPAGVADPRPALPHRSEPPNREWNLHQATSQTARAALLKQHALGATTGFQGPAMNIAHHPSISNRTRHSCLTYCESTQQIHTLHNRTIERRCEGAEEQSIERMLSRWGK